MKPLLAVVLLLALAPSRAAALDERDVEELSCRPVRGYVQLPGIRYDDLTPLAREVFQANPASVTNALYALPQWERDDFLDRYLEPAARERHRYFFARCRELAVRRARGVREPHDVVPDALRRELREGGRAGRVLENGILSVRIGRRTVYVPAPDGYVADGGPSVLFVRENGVADNLALFHKIAVDPDLPPQLPLVAEIDSVRNSNDAPAAVLDAYRTLVDRDWRPIEIGADSGKIAAFQWNLHPFNVGADSFCYGKFDKTVDDDGQSHIRYRATGIVVLPGCHIQVNVMRAADIDLDQVDEINADLVRWRDAIRAANGQYPLGIR